MDKTLSKDQLKEIMNSAPAGVDKVKLFRKYVDSGYQIEGYNTPAEPGLGSKLVDRAKNIGKEVATFGTLGMNTLDPNTPKDQQDLAVVGGLAQAGAAPARALIQAGGAVGDVVGAGLEATGLDKVISKVVSPVVNPVVQSEAFKKASDAFSMLPEETQTLLKGLPEVANLFGVSPAASIVKKGVTNAVTSTGEAIAKRSAQTAIKDASKIDNLAGTIVQGKADDILKAKKALTDIDITGIKTYKDLVSTLDDKITSLSTGLDDVLSTKPTPKALDDLNLNVKVGEQSVTHNYVKDAVSQLDDLYTKTNNIEGKTKIAQLLQKAEAEGLTIKEVNDLARLHGKELNAFNANGQAASGLTKQAAENTRVGLKSTARDLFDDPVYKQTDTEISNLIRTRDLVDGVSEKVNQLKQRIQERSLGAKVGVALGRAINLLSLGSAKGIVEALIPRGQGFKVMNALDLEEALGANLKKLQKALEGKSEAEIIKNLESIQASKVNLATSKNAINNTNSNIQAQSTPATPKSKGIRGMINFDEIISSVIPTKKILTEAKDAVEKLESTVSFVKSAKSPNAITDSRKELQTLMNKMGVETVVTGSNVNNVLEEAENMVSQLKAHIKKSESQSASSVMNREFDTKKKVASSLEQEAKKYKSADEFITNTTELNYKNLQENDYSIKAYGKDFNEPVDYFRAGAVRKNGDIWLTDNEAGARQYSSAGGGTKIGSYIVQSKNPLIIDTAGGKYAKGNVDIKKILSPEELSKGYTNNPDTKAKFIKYAKDNGYDAVQFSDSFPDGEGGMRSLVVWDKNQVKTKKQLVDIWKLNNR